MQRKVAFLFFLLTFVLTLPATANSPDLDAAPAFQIHASSQN
jgi:hypothetical protein